MRVGGAIDDQNTVTLDGIDITQNIVATGTSVPTPADSVEEFTENVSNPSATMGRASGGAGHADRPPRRKRFSRRAFL